MPYPDNMDWAAYDAAYGPDPTESIDVDPETAARARLLAACAWLLRDEGTISRDLSERARVMGDDAVTTDDDDPSEAVREEMARERAWARGDDIETLEDALAAVLECWPNAVSRSLGSDYPSFDLGEAARKWRKMRRIQIADEIESRKQDVLHARQSLRIREDGQ